MPKLVVPEIWKEVPGWPAYIVSDHGRVMSRWVRKRIPNLKGAEVILGERWKEIKPSISGNATCKRLTVTLGGGVNGSQKTYGVAYLVLLAFVRPPTEGEVARHVKDPDPHNCRLENLGWGTRSENAADELRHNGKHHNSKLLPAQVKEILGLVKDGMRHKDVAAIYGVSPSLIGMILRGQCQKLALAQIAARAP